METDWLTTWTMITGIGSAVIAIAIAITAVIVGKTLISNKKAKMEELSTKMANIWYEGKYEEKLSKISLLHLKVIKEEYKDYEYNWETIKISFDLKSVENYIYKLNYFLDSNRLSLENIYIDFYNIFSLYTQPMMTVCYGELKWAHNWLKFDKSYNGKSIIDIFFKKLAKHLKYGDLIAYIEK